MAYAYEVHNFMFYYFQIRMNSLACIDKLLDSVDKMTILDEVIPFLTEITYQDTEVLMVVIGTSLLSLYVHNYVLYVHELSWHIYFIVLCYGLTKCENSFRSY